MTPKSDDLLPKSAKSKPLAASPLFSNSRTAAARLGIRASKRKLSSAVTSFGERMITRRSSRDRLTMDDLLGRKTVLLAFLGMLDVLVNICCYRNVDK